MIELPGAACTWQLKIRAIRSMPERDEDGQYVHRDDEYSCEECQQEGSNI